MSALETAVRKGRAVEYVKGFSSERDEMTEEDLKQACEAAAGADVVVIFAGLPDSFESEGYDRTSMELPKCQNRLIEAVAEIQKNVVVVLHNGSPVETPWAESVNAILEMYLGGEGIGEASDRLLFGEANPGGRLAETFPYRLEDNPSYLNFLETAGLFSMEKISLSDTVTMMRRKYRCAGHSAMDCHIRNSATAI